MGLLQMLQEIFGYSGNIGNSGIKCGLIHFRRRAKSADLADELERGGSHFFRSGRRFGPSEDFNAAAHFLTNTYYAIRHNMELVHEPKNPNGCGLVLTHGAGGNANAPLLVAVAEAFCSAGVLVRRYDLPFRQKRRFGPPSPAGAAGDREGLREAVAEMCGLVKGRVFLGGHSYGGRQATMLAAEEPGLVEAMLLLSYPLHPPGQPLKLRTGHFPALQTPAVFIHGTKDEFGSMEEMRAALGLIPAYVELVPLEGAGHDLKKGRFEVGQAAFREDVFGFR
jgi:predicted alpha/beta-hydrolase family hydrolase